MAGLFLRVGRAKCRVFCYHQNMKSPFRPDPFPVSGRGYVHVCPHCSADSLELYDLRDGDQAYWCHRCERGHRAGNPPLEAFKPLLPAV